MAMVKKDGSPTVYGIATIGTGPYTSGSSKKKTHEYQTWFDMIRRCYSEKNKKYANYGGRGITVCNEWLNFQNFADWYHQNHKDGFKLDKDLTNIGAMQYSPENCEFIPVDVNNLFVSSAACRGKWPVGVSFSYNRFKAECWDGNKRKHVIGYFSNPDDAFNAYALFKRGVIDSVAEKHYQEGNISKKIYDNLINWKIVPYPE